MLFRSVALEVADDVAVEVELVQVAAAVVQAIEPAAVGREPSGAEHERLP